MFLLKWVGFASFGVDSVTYYPFDVFSGPMSGYFVPLHYAGFVLIVLSLVAPLVLKGVKEKFLSKSIKRESTEYCE